MKTIKICPEKKLGKFKYLNAVNNGPITGNFEDYKAARIPYARTHDASFYAGYGGEHTVDISSIFTDFDADPYDEKSYDFVCTDHYLLSTLDADTKIFYRLGQKIEHYVKKFNIYPPKDFKKWAVICEHIIKHYNYGWANGYELGIEYWEIWNEADLDPEDAENKKTWMGTKAQFFDFYETAAKHLKACFPELKIGGPALAHDREWADHFLAEMKKRNVPIDFFSWHVYCADLAIMFDKANFVDGLLKKYDYQAENILNEWNYVKNWKPEGLLYSKKVMLRAKGAVFVLTCMLQAQHSPIDMLMYYDARPCSWNGMFDFYTNEPLKGYYPFKWYGMFYDCECEIECENQNDNVYALSGIDKDGKTTTIITYYSDEKNLEDITINVDFGRKGCYEVYLLDENHTAELVDTTEVLNIKMTRNSAVLIKEV